MPGILPAHPTWISWSGATITNVRTWTLSVAEGERHDMTNITSQIAGSGTNARVIRSYAISSIEPPTLSLTYFGVPPTTTGYSWDAMNGVVSELRMMFLGPGGTTIAFTTNAMLLSWVWEAGSNVFQEGACDFLLQSENVVHTATKI